MLKTKQIRPCLSLVLACGLLGSMLTGCQQADDEQLKAANLPALHVSNTDLSKIYAQTGTNQSLSADQAANNKIRMQGFADLIERYLKKKKLEPSNIAIELYNFKRQEHFALNSDKYFTAASTYKFPLAVIYYDLLRTGKVKKESSIKLNESEVIETYGVGANSVGSLINVDDLLNPMIINSDNTAAHMLFEELGGFRRYKELVCENVGLEKDPQYLADGNNISTQILSAFAKKVYEKQADYEVLLFNMQKAEPMHYLNLLPSMHNVMTQKYGSYAEALNSVGLQLNGPEQYSLVVLTKLGGAGEQVIAEISALAYAFYYPDKIKAEDIIEQAQVFQAFTQSVYDPANGNLGSNVQIQSGENGDSNRRRIVEDDPSIEHNHSGEPEYIGRHDEDADSDYGSGTGSSSGSGSESGSSSETGSGSETTPSSSSSQTEPSSTTASTEKPDYEPDTSSGSDSDTGSDSKPDTGSDNNSENESKSDSNSADNSAKEDAKENN